MRRRRERVLAVFRGVLSVVLCTVFASCASSACASQGAVRAWVINHLACNAPPIASLDSGPPPRLSALIVVAVVSRRRV